MTHDPERDAAFFLGGAMRSRRARRFEQHVLECEACWQEVRAGRTGRTLAESGRELAPQHLRETLRASIAAAGLDASDDRSLRARSRVRSGFGVRLAAALTVVALAVTGGVLLVRTPSPSQPAAISAAVGDFRSSRIPTMRHATRPAPDLSAMSLTLDGSGAGQLEGVPVDAFLYHDTAGRRLLLYLSDDDFPIAAGARHGTGTDAPWRASVNGLEMLCSQQPHGLLAVTSDASLLDRLAERLSIRAVPA